MAATRTCPECGMELTPGALEGLCPKCLGKVTFGLDPDREPCRGTDRFTVGLSQVESSPLSSLPAIRERRIKETSQKGL
jgi:hypothetical protein